jgi:chorismate mutase/ubiquinone/menaquinone biosynthesis C-methylase UbiE
LILDISNIKKTGDYIMATITGAKSENTTLGGLRIDLDKTDQHIVALLSKRIELIRKIEESKFSKGEPILHEETEQKKLGKIVAQAQKRGLSVPFVEGLFYGLFSESCRVQAKQRDQRNGLNPVPENETEDERYRRLKQNLLDLTDQLLPEYKDAYSLDSFGTISYLDFEKEVIKNEVGTLLSLGNNKLAIDLGCGVGLVSFSMTPHFERVMGFDISPSMVQQASWTKKCTRLDTLRASFEVLDIEDGLPLESESVSFVAMTMGTASDVKNIRRVLASIKRVLKKDGRFALSFYNSAALFYRWSLPWQVSLMAEINPIDHCLNVHVGDKIFQLYARPYTKREVRKLLTKEGFLISSLYTYPALAAILPNGLFYGVDEAQRASHRREVRSAVLQEEETKITIRQIDKGLIDSDMGAYILVTGRKA